MTSTHYQVLVQPVEEPVSLAELRGHLRVTHTDEDSYIAGLGLVARSYIESTYDLALCAQTIEAYFQSWPKGMVPFFRLPIAPARTLSALEYVPAAGDGSAVVVPSSVYRFAAISRRVSLGYGQSWPAGPLQAGLPIRAEYEAGYVDAGAVPAQAKHAILMLAEFWYVNRSAVTAETAADLARPRAFAVEALVSSLRR